MDYTDLNTLEELRRNGSISEENYQKEKERIMSQVRKTDAPTAPLYWGMTENSYIALMHVAQFAGFVVPFLGFVLPIVMWTINKEQNANIDRHGKNIINFMISFIIYVACSSLLAFLLVGIPLLVVLGVLELVFVIMAGVKAANGEYWKYPLSFTFLK